MTAFGAEALIATLDAIGARITAHVQQHRVTRAWYAGTLDRDRIFALQAQLYHIVSRSVPNLERSADTCERLAASDPMYAVVVPHYRLQAWKENQPRPHELILLDDMRRQGFTVDRLPPPCPAVRAYQERGAWGAEHTPLRELGRAFTLETLSRYASPRAAAALASARHHDASAAEFFELHAREDGPAGGHADAHLALLRELAAHPGFAARAADVAAGGQDADEVVFGMMAYVDALPGGAATGY